MTEIKMSQFSNDLDYAFGKIDGMDGVRDMFYPGGVIQKMLDTLSPEEFKQVINVFRIANINYNILIRRISSKFKFDLFFI